VLGTPLFEPRALDAAVPLSEGLMTSEFVITRRLPAGAQVLAATKAGDPVVFSARRGAGAVIFSGALDAWRYRGSEAFAKFWRRVMAEEAVTVPPVLEVSVEPAIVAVGEPARVRARLRATEFSESSVVSPRSLIPDPRPPTPDLRSLIPDPRSPTIDMSPVAARAVSPGARVDSAVRLWPTAEPGVYEGEWRPTAAGDYDLAVTAGAHRGDAAVTVVASQPARAAPEELALAARASGGRVFSSDQALVEGLKDAFPARTVTVTMNPMRSPWWVVPFAGLLCVEWAVRRKRGLP
jgi:hypothetical protein